MRQPELGQKLVELRKQKNLTQEELAEICHLNVRSIQRVEAGKVTPRPFTLRMLSDALDYQLNSERDPGSETWLILMHLSSIVPLIFVPLLIWIWKRDESPEIEHDGVDVLNFQISLNLYLFSAALLIFVAIGLVILPILGITIFYITMINTIKVAMGKTYHYPLTISFIKHS